MNLSPILWGRSDFMDSLELVLQFQIELLQDFQTYYAINAVTCKRDLLVVSSVPEQMVLRTQ